MSLSMNEYKFDFVSKNISLWSNKIKLLLNRYFLFNWNLFWNKPAADSGNIITCSKVGAYKFILVVNRWEGRKAYNIITEFST